MDTLVTGLVGELDAVVSQADTAERWGSGHVPVLATPFLVGLMEGAALRALAGHLPAGKTSVGGRIDVRHLAATPVGMRVRVRAELVAVSGRRLTLRVDAWDEVEHIGTATHERFIVDEQEFICRAQAKARPTSA